MHRSVYCTMYTTDRDHSRSLMLVRYAFNKINSVYIHALVTRLMKDTRPSRVNSILGTISSDIIGIETIMYHYGL